MEKRWVIKHENGTYYRQWTAIGPCFGAGKLDAERFASKETAERLMADWRFAGCVVEVANA